MLRLIFLCFALVLSAAPPFKKVEYQFSDDPIDVVIPCVPKDLLTLELCIDGIKKNGKNIRRIIVLSKEPMTANAEWFSEDLFPFTKKDIALEIFHGNEEGAAAFIASPMTRIGWIFQQLLKLYTPFVIPNISPNVLILDSDVIFLKKIRFIEDGEPCFIPGKEYFTAYFEHAARLLPGLKRVNMKHSGIAHHMLFQKPVLEDLFRLVEEQHKTEMWRAMCRSVDMNELYRSCMSEYEIYFNFIQLRSDQARINPVKWAEIHTLRLLPQFRRGEEVFVACPEWFRKLYGSNE